jgi:hypothetical protein
MQSRRRISGTTVFYSTLDSFNLIAQGNRHRQQRSSLLLIQYENSYGAMEDCKKKQTPKTITNFDGKAIE